MLEIEKDAPLHSTPSDTLVLSFDMRQKSRVRVKLLSGREAALHLERGRVLRDGQQLIASDGSIVLVRAAEETVSTVRCVNAQQLARVAYHLGNRHVPLQVGDGFVRYQHDHVLDDMVSELGLRVQVERAPFEPESGAYGHGNRSHEHSHDGGHGHGGHTHER
jgi:urease accessory protein